MKRLQEIPGLRGRQNGSRTSINTLRSYAHSVVLPHDDLLAGGQVESWRRGARRENLHQRCDGSEDATKPIHQFLRSLGRLYGSHRVDRKAAPIRGGGLVAWMKITHVAKETGQCLQVLQTPARQRPRRLERIRVSYHFEGNIVDPRFAGSAYQQAKRNVGSIRIHIA